MLVKLLATLFGLYCVALLLALIFQRQLLYFPSHMDRTGNGLPPFAPFRTASGEFLGYIRQTEAPRRVVLFFHGNGGEALGRAWLTDLIPDPSVALILAEYPGYGARAGSPSEPAIVAAAVEIVTDVHRRFGKPVTLLGESLGTGVASAAAHLPGVDRIALISPFTSIAAVGQAAYPWLPVTLLLRDRFDSQSRLRNLSLPLFVVHGEVDSVVPFSQGKALFQSYTGGKKQFTALPDTGHNDIVAKLLTGDDTADFRRFLTDENI